MHDVFFGLFLVEKNAAEREAVMAALHHQRQFNKCIGELAIVKGYLLPEQADDLFATQAGDRRPFGAIAVERGYLKPDELDELLFMQTIHCRRLGEMLFDQGLLVEPGFSALLTEYEQRETEERNRLVECLQTSREGERMLMMLDALSLTMARFCGVVCKAVAGVSPQPRAAGNDAGQDEEYGCQTLLCDAGDGERKPLRLIFARSTIQTLTDMPGECGGLALGAASGDGTTGWLDAACSLFERSGAFCTAAHPCLVKPASCERSEAPEPCPEGVTLYLGLPSSETALMYVYPPPAEAQ